ncbi:MAG: VWA domain-containing protein [Gammaproteobacteria bacterium]|nr:VWA domain-containing protein [Gammaproteobacteria bacterium]
MMQFAWPWMFLLLPLPWFARRFLPPAEPSRGAALRVPFLRELARPGQVTRLSHRQWPLWLALSAWLLMVVASGRPQWLGDPVTLPVSGRDLVLAVDLSQSMQERDFQIRGQWVDRLTATKWVANDFIARREGDRIGLILFGEQAYLQTPLTFDRTTVLTLLNEAQIGLAGRATAIGDAIGLAVKRLRGDERPNRVLILMTDGANTAGEVEPLQAAELAAREGLTIYTIGIGADEMIVRGLLGTRRVNPSADLDEETLRAIAAQTGGQYFRARDTAELDEIYRLLDELEPVESDPETFRPVSTLYYWPLAGALALISLLMLIKVRERAI